MAVPNVPVLVPAVMVLVDAAMLMVEAPPAIEIVIAPVASEMDVTPLVHETVVVVEMGPMLAIWRLSSWTFTAWVETVTVATPLLQVALMETLKGRAMRVARRPLTLAVPVRVPTRLRTPPVSEDAEVFTSRLPTILSRLLGLRLMGRAGGSN